MLPNTLAFLEALTANDLRNGPVSNLLDAAAEEYSEVKVAIAIEDGWYGPSYPGDPQLPPEPSRMEAIDLAICGLALYFARGGKQETLAGDMLTKLVKWAKKCGFEDSAYSALMAWKVPTAGAANEPRTRDSLEG